MIIDQKTSKKINKIAINAGKEILKIYKKPFISKLKIDGSPVTEADLAANKFICKELTKLDSKIPIISEENMNKKIKKSKTFWLVDPLDGTKEFIKKNGEFTVNIALIKNEKPIHGVIYWPVKKIIYYTINKKSYYSKLNKNNDLLSTKRVQAKKRKGKNRILITSRSHAKNIKLIKEKLKITHSIIMGSSIKFCYIASGKANIYPRIGNTMEWDTAAGDAILRNAGGRVRTLNGKVLKYGKRGFKNKSFIARS